MGTFRDVVLRYNLKQPPSLRGVSFVVDSGERVGVVGRSGSGKSTLLAALLRLVELESGSISIDGVDIASLSLSTLRTNLAVIMQDPVLFQGDMRSNLDPEAKHDDRSLCAMLQRVRLAVGGEQAMALLDATVGESGDNWSNGQRQLICCARALLKCARISCSMRPPLQLIHSRMRLCRTRFASSARRRPRQRSPSLIASTPSWTRIVSL